MKELILGGARSGKSALAEQRALASGFGVSYIATAEVGDAEMAARIAMHRARRPDRWQLVEEPITLAAVLRQEAAAKRCIIVDCLTLWLSNLLADGIEARAAHHDSRDGGGRTKQDARAEGGCGCGLGADSAIGSSRGPRDRDVASADSAPVESPLFVRERAALLDALPGLPGHIILIGNEVGLGIVPLGSLSRRFCDEAGRLHQDLARVCDRVILTVAGLPYVLKGDRL